MFIFQPEAEERPAGEQEFRFVEIAGSEEEVHRAHPKERLERVHGEARGVAEDYGSEKDRKARQADSETFAAELARDQSGDEDFRALRERGKRANGVERIAESETADARE